jgi:non-specific serine/threonine protein kinase
LAEEHNVPLALTPLIGRARELRGIGDTLRKARLVTVTGPGGVGKTRLAIEFARSQIGRRPDGVWFVDLALGAESPDVAAEMARMVDVRSPSGTTPTAALRAYLAERDVLLVLDNCEHVADACAELARALLTSCPKARIVATSRESLGVGGETVWRLEPLGPDDARRLFVERARQRQPDFIPTPEADSTIAGLCDRLDRLPLAIEIAAARVSVMSPEEILAGFETRLGLLDSHARLAPPRHRTVRAAVEWSYELLDPAEREALRSLSVFVGSFDADAAESVAAGLSFDLLARLVDKSLVAVAQGERKTTRYRLLETVREYAYGLLGDAGEVDAVRDRHLDHYSKLAEQGSDGWPSPNAERLVAELDEDYENIRAALEWAASRDPCAARSSLFAARDLFILLGQSDGRRLADLLLERCLTLDRSRIESQITAGLLAMLTVDIEAARARLRAARELAAELDEPSLEGWAALFHGLTDTLGGELEQGRAHLEEARALHQRHGVRIGEAGATAALGLAAAMTGDTDRGMELLETALGIQLAEGYHWGLGQAHVYLAMVTASNGAAPERVTRHSKDAVASLRRYRDSSLLPVALTAQASTLVRSDPERALMVAAAASAIRMRIGGGYAPVFRAFAERVAAEAEAAVGPDAPGISSHRSRLGVDDAIALAFGTPRTRAAGPGGLSARELEIASLVAQGMSNKAIASRLQLSVRTVESHVRHALTKLALENRTQLATWARERTQ